jgi:hypothetical protein
MTTIQKTSEGKEIVVFNDDADDIRNIAFEKITDEFSFGKYGDFNVIIMNKNGYINATKLCQEGNKRLLKWNQTKHAKELEEEIIKKILPNRNGSTEIKYVINGGNIRIINGTYVHPKLIPHIASWISPAFAIKVADIVNEYFTKEALHEKDKLLQRKDNECTLRKSALD